MAIKEPCNIDAEKHVLGSMICDLEALHRARAILDADDFYEPRHKVLFAALCNMADARTPIDLIGLADYLEKRGELLKIGGGFYLAELATSIVTTANVEYHAEISRDRADRRKVIRLCDAAIKKVHDEPVLSEVVTGLQNDLGKIGGKENVIRLFKDYTGAAIEMLQERHQNMIEGRKNFDGLSTGLHSLDEILGGLRPGNQIILAARPSEGKSALALQIALQISQSANGLYFSYEMTGEELSERAIAILSGVNLRRFPNREEGKAILLAGGSIENLALYLDDTAPSIDDLIHRTRRFNYETKVDFICIDYLQLIHSNKRFNSRCEEISDYSRKIKLLATEINCPILTVCQLSRDIEKRGGKGGAMDRPKLSDLRDSGSIEQDANQVIFIHCSPDEDRTKSGDRELIVAKNRAGGLGTAYVYFEKECTRFTQSNHNEDASDIF